MCMPCLLLIESEPVDGGNFAFIVFEHDSVCSINLNVEPDAQDYTKVACARFVRACGQSCKDGS